MQQYRPIGSSTAQGAVNDLMSSNEKTTASVMQLQHVASPQPTIEQMH